MSLAKSILRTSQKYKYVCGPALKMCLSSNAESFLCGANANFLEAQYLEWSKSRGSGAIDSKWDGFYDSVCGPALKIEEMQDDFSPTTVHPDQKKEGGKSSEDDVQERIKLNLAVASLIRSYQSRGHLLAKTDPLGLTLPARLIASSKNLPLDSKGIESVVVARELTSML
ncbi:hypothetical protein B5X24_HaOG216370, partial [Helicoverpa armigera]